MIIQRQLGQFSIHSVHSKYTLSVSLPVVVENQGVEDVLRLKSMTGTGMLLM